MHCWCTRAFLVGTQAHKAAPCRRARVFLAGTKAPTVGVEGFLSQECPRLPCWRIIVSSVGAHKCSLFARKAFRFQECSTVGAHACSVSAHERVRRRRISASSVGARMCTLSAHKCAYCRRTRVTLLAHQCIHCRVQRLRKSVPGWRISVFTVGAKAWAWAGAGAWGVGVGSGAWGVVRGAWGGYLQAQGNHKLFTFRGGSENGQPRRLFLFHFYIFIFSFFPFFRRHSFTFRPEGITHYSLFAGGQKTDSPAEYVFSSSVVIVLPSGPRGSHMIHFSRGIRKRTAQQNMFFLLPSS